MEKLYMNELWTEIYLLLKGEGVNIEPDDMVLDTVDTVENGLKLTILNESQYEVTFDPHYITLTKLVEKIVKEL